MYQINAGYSRIWPYCATPYQVRISLFALLEYNRYENPETVRNLIDLIDLLMDKSLSY
jgi:hypothetical protein